MSNSTIADVGKRAGCSPATVSRVLNNSGAVSAATREAVLRSARDLGYVGGAAVREKNRTASGRVTGRAVEVVLHCGNPLERLEADGEGVRVDTLESFPGQRYFKSDYRLSSSFHRELIDGVVDELKKWGHKAVVQIAVDLASSDFLNDVNMPDKMGVLLLGEPSPGVKSFCDNCVHPLVLVDILCRSWPDIVTSDNYRGIGLAVKHLAELGHRDIGFVGWSQNATFQERRTGFFAALHEAGLAFRPEWCCEATVHIEEKAIEVAELLARADRPSALVCSNDYQALSVVRAASRVGLSIPRDLSVVGFDDIELSQYVSPALTTIRVPVAEMGRIAVRQLLLASEYRETGVAHDRQGVEVRVRPELVVRESTARPAR
ncbi:MAG: LacI family DNA-binding transcriptional regulator [Planctomycetales bacterium]|nr:LacI family DNA-binding transcriptional regulator [Planctomycetales bacterium]